MPSETFKIKYEGKTLKVRLQGRDEKILPATLVGWIGDNDVNPETLKNANFGPSRCVGDQISIFDPQRVFIEVVSKWYAAESTGYAAESTGESVG